MTPDRSRVYTLPDRIAYFNQIEQNTDICKLVEEYATTFKNLIELLLTDGGCIGPYGVSLVKSRVTGLTVNMNQILNNEVCAEYRITELQPQHQVLLEALGVTPHTKTQGGKAIFFKPNSINSLVVIKTRFNYFFRLGEINAKSLISSSIRAGEPIYEVVSQQAAQSKKVSLIRPLHLATCILLTLATEHKCKFIEQ